MDRRLSEQMGLTRRLVELGRSARAAASLGIRQPLPRALVGAAGFAGLPAELRDQVASELNVRALDALSEVADDLVDHVVKPNFRTLGRRFGNRTQAVAAAIAGRTRPRWPASSGARARHRSWWTGSRWRSARTT